MNKSQLGSSEIEHYYVLAELNLVEYSAVDMMKFNHYKDVYTHVYM